MTTAAEIRRWTRPLLDGDPNLVLVGRNLILKPVQHILRGISVDRTSNSHLSDVWYFLAPLFNVPGPSKGFNWGEQIVLGRNDSLSFPNNFVTECRSAIDEVLIGIETIGDLVEQASRDDLPFHRRLGPVRIKHYYRDYCAALAALGRLDEARAVLAKVNADEASFRLMLQRGQAVLAKRANSEIGRGDVYHASVHLATIAELKRLAVFLEAGDRAGIGGLLREWERYRVKLWDVEHLWEPTPFPVELGEGD